MDALARQLDGLSYLDARFFLWDLGKKQVGDVGPALNHKVYFGPERINPKPTKSSLVLPTTNRECSLTSNFSCCVVMVSNHKEKTRCVVS